MGVRAVVVPAVIFATGHHLMRTMLDADRHTECGRVEAGGISGAAGCGAELGDVFEWHGESLFFRARGGVRVHLQLDPGKLRHRERFLGIRTLLSVLYKAGFNPFFLSFSKNTHLNATDKRGRNHHF